MTCRSRSHASCAHVRRPSCSAPATWDSGRTKASRAGIRRSSRRARTRTRTTSCRRGSRGRSSSGSTWATDMPLDMTTRRLEPYMTLAAKRALVIAAIALTGCSTDKVLQVDRPDIIDPNGLNNPAGVTALHAGVIGDRAAYMDAAVGVNAAVGLFTDELRFGATPPEIKQFDTRSLIEQNTLLWAVYRNIQQLRGQADRAADALKKVSATDTRVGEMNALSGFAYVLLGELFCSGVPIGNIGEEADPIATTAVLQGGIAKIDAATAAAGSDARIKNLAAVLKGRTLLDLGQFDAAAAAVASVPTDFKYTTFHSAATPYQQNGFWNYMFNSDGLLVSDKEGTNGLNFATANDPRVAISGTGGPSRFDGVTPRWYFA